MKKSYTLFAVALLIAIAIAAAVKMKYRSPKVENFLLITIDTLRADHLGCYGYSSPTSPSLDALAAESTLFENAFCLMPTTVPSHGALFYSTWPRVHGSTSNFHKISNEKIVFLPDLLRQNGYQVGAFAANKTLAKAFKHKSSFAGIPVPKETRTAEQMFQTARLWLKERRGKKFFLWVHLWDPHSPYERHPQFLKKVGSNRNYTFKQRYDFLEKPYTKDQVAAMIELYDNEIAYTDDQLGKFLREFRGNYGNNTMIIVTSDHGESMDELIASEGYAFDHGEYLFDHQIRVPLLLHVPEMEGGKRISTAVTLLDVMPTILEQAGIPLPSSAHGASLLPLVNGKDRGGSLVLLQRRDFDFPPRPFLAQRQYAIRDRNFKLLWNQKDNVTLLLRNDEEGEDISAGNPRLAQQLQQRLHQWLRSTEALSKGEKETVSPEEAEQIRALGYVQ